jgi:hypothetical protein
MPARVHPPHPPRPAETGRGRIVALAGWSTDGHRLGLWADAEGQTQVIELDWFEDQFRQTGAASVATPIRPAGLKKMQKQRKAPRTLVSLAAAPPSAGARR